MSDDKGADWENDLVVRCHWYDEPPEEFVSWSSSFCTNALL